MVMRRREERQLHGCVVCVGILRIGKKIYIVFEEDANRDKARKGEVSEGL